MEQCTINQTKNPHTSIFTVQVLLIIAYLCNLCLEPLANYDVKDLSIDQQNWFKSGQMMKVGQYNMFYKMLEYTGNEEDYPTIVIVHGFPSSSYDYHKKGFHFQIVTFRLKVIIVFSKPCDPI